MLVLVSVLMQKEEFIVKARGVGFLAVAGAENLRKSRGSG